MPRIERVELQCVTCKNWVHRTLPLDTSEVAAEISLIGQCPTCGVLAPFSPDRVRPVRLTYESAEPRADWVAAAWVLE